LAKDRPENIFEQIGKIELVAKIDQKISMNILMKLKSILMKDQKISLNQLMKSK
jgi:hypothetical protein